MNSEQTKADPRLDGLVSIMVDSIATVVSSGKIQEAINKNIEDVFLAVLKDQMREYSEFGKRVKEAVAKSLMFNPDICIPSYNDFIVRKIEEMATDLAEKTIQKQIADNIKEFLTPAPESIKLSELVNMFKKECAEKAAYSVNTDNRIQFRIYDSHSRFRYIALSCDGKARGEYDHDIRIGCNDENVFSLTLKDKAREASLENTFFGFEKMLFQMKVAKSKIIFDVTEDDIELSYDVPSECHCD